MIVATLPLAGLLVWQILQSAGWVGDADALFAKNILWWFGHPGRLPAPVPCRGPPTTG